MVIVTKNSHRRGHKLRMAYKDIRLVPSLELLYKLEQLELELAKYTPKETDIYPFAMDSSSRSDAPSSKETYPVRRCSTLVVSSAIKVCFCKRSQDTVRLA